MRKMLTPRFATKYFPTIVCLCGSTRFGDAFRKINLKDTLAGRIVLTVGCDFKSDDELELDAPMKRALDELHKRKIDISDEILILNVDGYIGESTRGEIEYAQSQGKRLRWLEPHLKPDPEFWDSANAVG